MKVLTNILAIGLIALSITLFSCKKCMTCSTVCYKCIDPAPYDSTLIYSDRIGSLDSTNSVINYLVARGYNCTKISPDQTYQYCDDNQAFMTAVQNVGYVCQ